jgi:PKD repeat protein
MQIKNIYKNCVRNFITLSTILLIISKAYGQSCDQFIRIANGNLISSANGVAWMLDFGKIGFDSNNDIYVTGKDSYFLSKYDSLGSLLWNKSKSNSIAADLVVKGNNIFVTSNEFLLSKYDMNGNEIFPSVQVANASPAHIVSDQQSNVYICGQISSGTSVTFGSDSYTPPLGSAHSYFLVKYNSSGLLQWSKHIVTNTTYFQPISMAINNNSLYVLTSGNNLVQAGTVSVTSNYDRVVYKTTTNGNDSWLKLMPTGAPTNMSNDIEINSQGQIVFSGSGGLLLCDTTLTTANYYTYNFSIGGPLDQSLSIRNDDFVILSTSNALGFNGATHAIITGKMSNPSAATPIYINIPTQDITHRYLVELSPSGSLYGFFHTNGGNSDSAFVDMASIATNTSNNIVIAKFNPAFRLLPTSYPDEIIECGNQVVLGGSNGSPTPYQVTVLPTFSWSPTYGLSDATAQNPICSTTTSQNYTVNINGSCVTPVNVTVTNPSSFTYSTNALVATFAINGVGCNSFVWDFGNGNTSTINPNPIVTYTTAGTYGVCLQCNGQPSSCAQCINVTVPSTTGGGVGVEEVKTLGLSVYPNPANDFFTIENKNGKQNSAYVIVNSYGQQVLRGELIAETTTVDVSVLKPGFYTLQIGGAEQQVFKLIKK